MAGTQCPNVVLCWLLKELWNYWLMRSPAVAGASEYCGETVSPGVERVILGWLVVVFIGTLLGPEATRLGAYALKRCVFLVWCLRTVEWMRASLWSSC